MKRKQISNSALLGPINGRSIRQKDSWRVDYMMVSSRGGSNDSGRTIDVFLPSPDEMRYVHAGAAAMVFFSLRLIRTVLLPLVFVCVYSFFIFNDP